MHKFTLTNNFFILVFHYTGSNITIAGWGLLETEGKLSRYPLEISEKVLSDDECLSAVDVGYHYSENPKAMFCAYNEGTDACKVSFKDPVIYNVNSSIKNYNYDN